MPTWLFITIIIWGVIALGFGLTVVDAMLTERAIRKADDLTALADIVTAARAEDVARQEARSIDVEWVAASKEWTA